MYQFTMERMGVQDVETVKAGPRHERQYFEGTTTLYEDRSCAMNRFPSARTVPARFPPTKERRAVAIPLPV